MSKLKLQPDPTFKALVAISMAGAKPVEVEFTFKHRTRTELQKFIEASSERQDADTIMEAATAWELTDAFTKENVELLVENYIAAPRKVFETYLAQLVEGRAKN